MYGLLLIKRVLTSLRAQWLDRHLHECIIRSSTERVWFDVITKNTSRWEHEVIADYVHLYDVHVPSTHARVRRIIIKQWWWSKHVLKCQNLYVHTLLLVHEPHIALRTKLRTHFQITDRPYIPLVCKNHDVTMITIDYHVQETCLPLRNQSLSLNVISEHGLCANNIYVDTVMWHKNVKNRHKHSIKYHDVFSTYKYFKLAILLYINQITIPVTRRIL